jgi:hypothetical protein
MAATSPRPKASYISWTVSLWRPDEAGGTWRQIKLNDRWDAAEVWGREELVEEDAGS